MRIVCIADTHGLHRRVGSVPNGDVLVHAGDITGYGEIRELNDVDKWFKSLPHQYKIFVAGNHDGCFEHFRELSEKSITNAIYLQDSAVEIEGVKFYGVPFTPFFNDWHFNVCRNSPELEAIWSRIPKDTDVLITHGPPHGILDVPGDPLPKEEQYSKGCEKLALALRRVKPKLHIFGHIHGGAGQITKNGIQYINASVCNEEYQVVNEPIVVEI